MKDKTSEEKKKKTPSKTSSSSVKKSSDPSPPLPGLSKKTRPELVALAHSLGIKTKEEDRRIDLIERIKEHALRTSAPAPQKVALPKTPPAGSKADKKTTAPRKKTPAKTAVPPPLSTPAPPVVAPTAGQAHVPPARPGAAGWKDFLDIAFEPVRREKGHFVTILPLSPFRIMAFFGIAPHDPSPAFRNGHPEIVLKVRDITKAMEEKPRPFADDLPADYIFDVGTGLSDRWRIPLWSTHRWIEAWLGYYEEGTFRILARSKKIRTPRGGPARRWGNLFHLKEGSYLEKDLPWLAEDAALRRLARLPSSHERPSSQTRPINPSSGSLPTGRL